MTDGRETIVRRLAASLRAISLYSARHPLVERNAIALFDALASRLNDGDQVTIAFLDDEVIVDDQPVPGGAQILGSLARVLARAAVTKISVRRGTTRDELRRALDILAAATARSAASPDHGLASALEDAGVNHVTVGQVVADEAERLPPGIESAMRAYDSAMRTAQGFWETTRDRGQPDTKAARGVVNTLAQVVSDDRPSVMALTTLKRHDAYTFTHMVNVSVLTMALARAIGVETHIVRDFGLAALMHDIGKTRTPLNVLNKPGRLADDEMKVIQRHVIDGAEVLLSLPDMPRLAAIVAFEHHLRHDFTGYPEGAAPRPLNLCTMIVSIADVFDALRTNRPYRKGLATERVRDMLAEQEGTAFHPTLLRQFIRVVGLFPVGTVVRLDSGAVGIVTHEHPEDPFRPQVKVVLDRGGQRLDEPYLVNTWERERNPPGIAEAIDGADVGLDPVELL